MPSKDGQQKMNAMESLEIPCLMILHQVSFLNLSFYFIYMYVVFLSFYSLGPFRIYNGFRFMVCFFFGGGDF